MSPFSTLWNCFCKIGITRSLSVSPANPSGPFLCGKTFSYRFFYWTGLLKFPLFVKTVLQDMSVVICPFYFFFQPNCHKVAFLNTDQIITTKEGHQHVDFDIWQSQNVLIERQVEYGYADLFPLAVFHFQNSAMSFLLTVLPSLPLYCFVDSFSFLKTQSPHWDKHLSWGPHSPLYPTPLINGNHTALKLFLCPSPP